MEEGNTPEALKPILSQTRSTTSAPWWQHKEGTEFLATKPGTRKKPFPHTQSKQLLAKPHWCAPGSEEQTLPCHVCRTAGALLCHVQGKQDVAGAAQTQALLPPVLTNQLLHGGWTILLLNELISLRAEADKDHSFLTFALEGMIFITNVPWFCCYGLHSGHEQGGDFPQSHGSATAPKMNSWYYRLSFTHKSLIATSSFLTRLDKINIPQAPVYRVWAASPVSPTRWGNKHLILLLHKKAKELLPSLSCSTEVLHEKTIKKCITVFWAHHFFLKT